MCAGRLLPSGRFPIFILLEAEWHDHSAAGKIRSMKKLMMSGIKPMAIQLVA
jgi:hypothetical protein